MVKDQNVAGLSREYIIHPGETLKEILEDRNMSQKELSVRTGVSEKHVSTVINGQKNISPSFARKLYYALGIETEFWLNLQSNYDRELLEYEELHNISKEELDILKNLKEVLVKWKEYGWIESNSDSVTTVLNMRRLLGISNLCDIPKIRFSASFRLQKNSTVLDPYVLFAWQRMCELMSKDTVILPKADLQLLKNKIAEIKDTMFLKEEDIPERLEKIFAECGILFKIVPFFKGAPVQGLVKKTAEGQIILCITLRQKFADIFWFTLFHEIAHILKNDETKDYLDYESADTEAESEADKMAGDLLIDPESYAEFLNKKNYVSLTSVHDFAKNQNVQDYIVLGRLMREGIVAWSARPRYDWL